MTLLPGDLILTRTPGNVVDRDDDDIEARIDGWLIRQRGCNTILRLSINYS